MERADYLHYHSSQGRIERDRHGRLAKCRDPTCFARESRNAKAMNALGAGLAGTILGGVAGKLLFNRPIEGAVLGGTLGAGAGYVFTSRDWTGPRLDDLPVLGSYRGERNRSAFPQEAASG